jgi:hypothetical protein
LLVAVGIYWLGNAPSARAVRGNAYPQPSTLDL